MKTSIFYLFTFIGVVLLASCAQEGKYDNAKISTFEDSVSYSLGADIGRNVAGNFQQRNIEAEINKEVLISGFIEAINKDSLLITPEDANRVINSFFKAQFDKQFEPNKKEGQDFLAKNKEKEGVVTMVSGLQYEILQEGKGAIPVATDKVKVHYTGTLIDGTEFDSSVKRGQPAEFPVVGVIKGWTEALQMMPVGSKWKLYIPYDLAYGERQQGQNIKPYSTLIFEVELLEILK